MPSNQNAIVDILASSSEDQKIEVILESRDGTEQVMLRHSTWTDGLGWCSQKTIRLDSDQLDDLHRALIVARHRLNRRKGEAGQMVEPAKVIRLASLA